MEEGYGINYRPVKNLEQEHGNDLAFVVNHSGKKTRQESWVSSASSFQTRQPAL